MLIKRILKTGGMALAATVMLSGAAGAATFVGTGPGNDCTPDGPPPKSAPFYQTNDYLNQVGVITGTSPTCQLTIGNFTTPQVVKIENGGAFEVNPIYSSVITPDDFSFNLAEGSITYSPDVGLDPIITHLSVKQGNAFWVFATGSNAGFTLDWSDVVGTTDFSHVTAFNQSTVIPLPAAGWMLIAGLGALGALGRRTRRQTA